MAHLTNPLVTADQLYQSATSSFTPPELQDSARYAASLLTQAAGILLGMPQFDIVQAVVLLQRYWANGDNIMRYKFSDVSAASILITTKLGYSKQPVDSKTIRNIANVYGYLLSSSSTLSPTYEPGKSLNAEDYYVSEGTYQDFQRRIFNIESQILYELSFNTHVAIPHTWAITYLQALGVVGSSPEQRKKGSQTAKKAIAYLNTALLSPQMPYLTQQPTSLAVAAIYLAAKDVGVKLPNVEWWEVFDTDREDLGSIVLIMKSLEAWVSNERKLWGKTLLSRSDIEAELLKRSQADVAMDDEDRLTRMADNREV